MNMKPQTISGILLIGAVLGLPLQGWAEAPTNTVKRLLESVRSYKKETPSLSAQERAANAQAQKVAEETLAVPDLVKHVLGPQWEKLNASEQKDFTQLLVSLLQKIAYPKSAEFFGDLRIDYTNEKLNGTEAVVETLVSHPKEGQVAIEYKLRQMNGKWTIVDVLLDGVSLVTNVRTQMQQVITKESYQGLVKRMRDKLAESS
ncbi:MAG: ABC transporter substrate-binding protein [Deltaproteobacteria bacterium]|nr:ABC transporter substrate-binding protein [Deltaproteobacteria bacterium]